MLSKRHLIIALQEVVAEAETVKALVHSMPISTTATRRQLILHLRMVSHFAVGWHIGLDFDCVVM